MEGKKTLVKVIMVVLIFIAPELARGNNESVEGTWQGVLKTPDLELRVVFKVYRKPDSTLTATIDSPDQGSFGIPVDEVTFENGNLRLESKRIQGVFEGKINEDGSEIEGQWEQQGGRLPLIVKRVDEVQIEATGQRDSEVIQPPQKQLQNHISGKSHIATIVTLVVALVGLIGLIVFFVVKSSRR